MEKKRATYTEKSENQKSVNPTYSVPPISLPMEDERLLLYLLNNKKMNVRRYSIIHKIPRSTVYDGLKRLNYKGLVIYENKNIRISEKGKLYLEKSNKEDFVGVGGCRLECRSKSLSSHLHKLILPISDRRKFRDNRLNNIKNLGWKEIKMNNWVQYIIRFEDATLTINPHQVKITLYDIVAKDTEEIDERAFNRLLDYVNILKEIGIETEGAIVEEGHWARVDSILASWLCEKVDERYFLQLEDGTKFWVDYSHNKKEDETNNKIARKRLDTGLGGIMSGKYNLENININSDEILEIKQSLSLITTMEKVRLQHHIEENKLKQKELDLKIKELSLNNTPSGIRDLPSYIN